MRRAPSPTTTVTLDECLRSLAPVVGLSLILSVLIHVGATFGSKWYKLFTVFAGMILLFYAALLVFS